MDREVTAKLEAKLECNRGVCRRLLIELSELPGCHCIAHDEYAPGKFDKRDLSRVLHEQVKQTEFLERWVELSKTL
jgi:hypothetical protein